MKLVGSEQGSVLGLVGASDSAHVILEAEGANSSLKLRNKDGRQQLVTP